ncbi:MAG: ABC transporter ATP-binding protein [Planctomycetaceae bacterium]|jgi:iron complex transport system ATP-binding protein|nr:ABC transporter ATP-binding protein [Planctomycetaceae bacterium]
MPDEYLAVIGANGAGKTTLLKSLDLVLDHWTGKVLLQGESIRKFSRKEIARRIAFVRQWTSTAFSLTVRQVVEMGRYPHLKPLSPMSQMDHTIMQQAMNEMNVVEFAERPIETFSGGERQRVLLAAALVQEPELLLLDEPATFLDYQYQQELYACLKKINQRGTTIIEITHDVNRAVSGATQILAIAHGRLVFNGTPHELTDLKSLRNIYGIDFCSINDPRWNIPLLFPQNSR